MYYYKLFLNKIEVDNIIASSKNDAVKQYLENNKNLQNNVSIKDFSVKIVKKIK